MTRRPISDRVEGGIARAGVGGPVRAIAWGLLVVGAVGQLARLSGLTRLAVAAAVVAVIAAGWWWRSWPMRSRR